MKRVLNIKYVTILAVSLVLGVSFMGVAPVSVSAVGEASKDEVCKAIGGCAANAGEKVSSTLANVINILSAVVGAVAVIMVIVGGFRYITSAGDSAKAASARNTIIYALVGLVIVALAQVIVRFVLENVG